jgi:hypothetical protein
VIRTDEDRLVPPDAAVDSLISETRAERSGFSRKRRSGSAEWWSMDSRRRKVGGARGPETLSVVRA